MGRIRNMIRGALQRYGSVSVRRFIWNHEYRVGRWNSLDSMPADCVYPYIEKYARNGNILDLGCGPGTTGLELNLYDSYTGVDICDLAIEKARIRTDANHRSERNSYLQSDLLTYIPNWQYDVIFFGDSIYYFSLERSIEILNRYSQYLKSHGVFIIRTWIDNEKHRNMVRSIETLFDVLEKGLFADSQIAVIVFRSKPQFEIH